MDIDQELKEIERKMRTAARVYHDSEDPEVRRKQTKAFLDQLKYLHSFYNTCPEFYKPPIKNTYELRLTEYKEMEKNIGTIVKKVEVDTGVKGHSQKSEKEEANGALMATIVTERPNVHWEDIAGLFEAKKSLNEALVMPIKYPTFFTGNVQPWRGILLYGPPGTGKTFLAKACATECESTFFSVSSSDLMSKYVGESEKLIKQLFRLAQEKAPSIIFIDEIDSMCGNRSEGENESSRRVKTEFLVQMQGVGSKNDKVLILGATNLPWALDPAVRRRFERRVYIPLPEVEARDYLIRSKLKGLDKGLTAEDFKNVADKTEGFSGADLEILCRDAAFEPLKLAQRTVKFKQLNINGKVMYMPVEMDARGNFVNTSVYDLPERSLILPELTKADLEKAAARSKPSVSKSDLAQYEEWTKQFGVSD
jgi:vacuolar protein-sorting-associated protein 4